MPPPSLLTTTIRTGTSVWRSVASAFMSWKRPRSPVTIQVGRPVAAAAPIPDETRPSIPLAPRLARNSTSAAARRRGTPPGRGSACSRPCRRGRRRRRAAERARAGPARLGARGRRARSRSRPRRPPAAASQAALQPVGPGHARRPRRPAPRPAAPGSARTIAPAMRVGSFQPWPGSIDELGCLARGRRATGEAACRSASRRSAGRGRARAPRVGRGRSARRRR